VQDPPVSLWPDPSSLGPLTDLYQLTMMAGYEAAGRGGDRATFEMFVRRLPEGRAYLVFAGLEQAVGDLLRLRFTPEQVEAIRRLPAFAGVGDGFFEKLKRFRFEGDVWAVAEGTVVFAGEPLVRVEAPLPQAQLAETFLLASIGYPTLVASKASRVVEAAAGRPVFDFGLRRGHGPYAGMLAARAAYLAGCAGTSNVEAAIRLDIPCSGTMAHSWVQTFESERVAFEAFARVFPSASTLLVDTYDTEEGVRRAAAVEPPVQAVRIDSGDLLALSVKARQVLDAAGRTSVRIVGSGDLDEHSIARLVAAGAPVDVFGVGTELITSRDAPALSLVYKLVALNGEGRVKLSPGKRTYPLGKQVYRQRDARGLFCRDLVTQAGENAAGERLLGRVVLSGELAGPLPRLEEIRTHRARQVASLPPRLRAFDAKSDYALAYSDLLESEARRLGLSPRGG
jgi:nicotinate phosphoribosyltransferase